MMNYCGITELSDVLPKDFDYNLPFIHVQLF